MLTRALLLSLLSLIQLQVFAQEEKSKSTPQASKYTLKATLSDLLWSNTGILPIGLETKVHDKIGVTVEAGIPLFYKLPIFRTEYAKTIKSDMRFGLDVRYYFYQGPRHWGYVGVDGNYRRQNYRYENGGDFYGPSGGKTYFSSADVLKQVYTFNIIFGAQVAMGSRFFWTFQTGLGGKAVNQVFYNLENKVNNIYLDRLTLPIGSGEDGMEQDLFFNLPWAIRLCYSL
ncbi:MAG: hypothetical protein R2800_01685 [Flavipsychrobacter sp.]